VENAEPPVISLYTPLITTWYRLLITTLSTTRKLLVWVQTYLHFPTGLCNAIADFWLYRLIYRHKAEVGNRESTGYPGLPVDPARVRQLAVSYGDRNTCKNM